jgi:TolB-like protein
MAERKSYRFGPFLVDRRSACLRRDGVVVPLRPKTFDVLTYLTQHPGRLVPKTELIENVWQNLNVTPNSLAQCIREIRHALHDDTQAIVETVSKRGYLFALPVIAVDGNDAPLSAEEGESRALPLPDRPSIAVLPFDNMSGDPDQDYFADGISEDLITGLSRIRWLFVIARNSTFVYKGRAVDVRQVASKLGVRYVLEGSVRRAGQRLRVSAQLIDAVTGGHHWAEQYDRELGDIFAIQDEITRSVVGAIQPRLLAAEGVRAFSRSPGDLGAWELVARAQTHVWRLNRSDHEAAIDALHRAVDAYPDYAPARSLLGFCLVFSAHNGWIDRDQGLQAGRPHIVRAIALDDCDPWAQIALGYW